MHKNPIKLRKQIYRSFSENERSIPLFLKGWWLDVTCGEDKWDVALVMDDNKVIAAHPYCIVVKRVFLKDFIKLTQPQLTQFLGPWFKLESGKYTRILSRQKKLLKSLLVQLPRFDIYSQNWHYSITNWLPFYWEGFSQTTRYTYVLPDLTDLNKIWSGFQENIRREIRKSIKRYNLQVVEDVDLDIFLNLHKKVFNRQGKSLPYPESYVRRLDDECMRRKCRKIFTAEDSQGRYYASVYIVWDQNSAYYLMGGSDPLLRNSGAMSLCMWHAIRFAAKVTKKFDFEGSMLESVERYFRAFGAIQTPYFHVEKVSSKMLELFKCLRDILMGR